MNDTKKILLSVLDATENETGIVFDALLKELFEDQEEERE